MKTTKIHEQSHVGRLFRVLNMLQSVKYYRTEEIAEALGVSKRTVMRYIDDFRSAGFEIFIDRWRKRSITTHFRRLESSTFELKKA